MHQLSHAYNVLAGFLIIIGACVVCLVMVGASILAADIVDIKHNMRKKEDK